MTPPNSRTNPFGREPRWVPSTVGLDEHGNPIVKMVQTLLYPGDEEAAPESQDCSYDNTGDDRPVGKQVY